MLLRHRDGVEMKLMTLLRFLDGVRITLLRFIDGVRVVFLTCVHSVEMTGLRHIGDLAQMRRWC